MKCNCNSINIDRYSSEKNTLGRKNKNLNRKTSFAYCGITNKIFKYNLMTEICFEISNVQKNAIS